MHAYLSSFSVGNRAHELLALARGRKAAVIANALDHNRDGKLRREFAETQIDELRMVGFETEELDLRDYFGRPAKLFRRLEAVSLVWVTGGNTFLVHRAMRQSGFDTFVEDRKRTDGFVYGGFSAGACVAAPTLRGLDLVDTPDASAHGYTTDIIWDGLGIVPFNIAPHHESPHPDAAAVAVMVQHFIVNDMPFVTLPDGEAVVATFGDSSYR
jgi:dipeptidase E